MPRKEDRMDRGRGGGEEMGKDKNHRPGGTERESLPDS